jgi:hypothetical protein
MPTFSDAPHPRLYPCFQTSIIPLVTPNGLRTRVRRRFKRAMVGAASRWWARLFLQFWPDIAGMVSRDLVHPVFGALLLLSMRFMPSGVAGMVSAWRWPGRQRVRAFDNPDVRAQGDPPGAG